MLNWYHTPDTMEFLAMLLSMVEHSLPWLFLLLMVIAIAQQWVIHVRDIELDETRRSREYYYQEYRKIRGTQTVHSNAHDLPLVADSDEEDKSDDTI